MILPVQEKTRQFLKIGHCLADASKSNGTCESQLVKCPTLCTYGSQALQPVSTSTLRSAKCLIKFLVRLFSCTQCRIRRPGKGTCPNEQPLAVLYCGELKAFGSALALGFEVLFESQHFYLNYPGNASELPRELKAHLT